MKNKDFLVLIEAWTIIHDCHSEINGIERKVKRLNPGEKALVHRRVKCYLKGFFIIKLHEEMEHILKDCNLSIKEVILENTEAWVSQVKARMDAEGRIRLDALLILEMSLEGKLNELTILADQVGEYINKDQEDKPIHGVLFLHSETGTEGGYWAFQDKRFITPAKLGEGHDRWSYQGLHILENGDSLTIYGDERKISILWKGVIQLKNLGLFKESAFGYWIHNDQRSIEREVWAKWFFEERPAQLIKINPLLDVSSE